MGIEWLATNFLNSYISKNGCLVNLQGSSTSKPHNYNSITTNNIINLRIIRFQLPPL